MIRHSLSAAAASAALAVLFLVLPAAAQQDLSKVEIKTEQLADGVYLLRGAGGNIGVSVGPDGALVIDGDVAPLADKVLAAVRALDQHPIRFLLDTHWHGDHTGGNETFAKAGAVLVSQENVRARMSTEQTHLGASEKTPPAPPEALPRLTFTDAITFHWNGDEIHVYHLPPSHTDGDAVVCFERANVIHAGDLLFNGTYPYIDLAAGGSVAGMIAAADHILGMANDQTKIIPGHGPLTDRAGLRALRDMLAGIRGRVAKEIAAGKTKDEVVAARPTREFDATWGGGFMKPDRFAALVYESVKRE